MKYMHYRCYFSMVEITITFALWVAVHSAGSANHSGLLFTLSFPLIPPISLMQKVKERKQDFLHTGKPPAQLPQWLRVRKRSQVMGMHFLFMPSNRDFQVYTFKAFPPVPYLGHKPFMGWGFTARGFPALSQGLWLYSHSSRPRVPSVFFFLSSLCACGIKRTKGKISLRKILEPRTHNLFSHYRGGAGPWPTGKQTHVLPRLPCLQRTSGLLWIPSQALPDRAKITQQQLYTLLIYNLSLSPPGFNHKKACEEFRKLGLLSVHLLGLFSLTDSWRLWMQKPSSYCQEVAHIIVRIYINWSSNLPPFLSECLPIAD